LKYSFELYILGDSVNQEQLQKLYDAVNAYSGFLPKFRLIVTIKGGVVRYFVLSDRDLGAVANNLDGLMLRSISKDELKTPRATSKKRMLQFVTGGNLIDFKEKYQVKTGNELEYAMFDIRAINGAKAIVKAGFYFTTPTGGHVLAPKVFGNLPFNLLEADFSGTNARYTKKSIGKYLDIEKSSSLLTSDSAGSLFEVDGFPYFTQEYFIGLGQYEFDKHSFLVGASGSGKSKLISLFIDRLANSSLRNNYRVIVVDPHASLAEDLIHIPSSKVVNFTQDSAQLFTEGAQDIQAATELTTVLFKSLIGDQFNPRLERTLRFSLYVLMTSQSMTLDNLKRFLTETELRTKILNHVTGYVPANIIHFFGGDFNEMRTQHFADAIQPITALVEELQLQPMLGAESSISLGSVVNSNFLTIFSLNKVSMGEKVVKTVAGLIIQQIFLLSQSRAFNEKIILIIDEVSVVQTPALAQILAEARKFNLSVILSQQYFGQIDRDLQAAIFANVYNYYVFKVSEEDARALEGNLSIELPKALIMAEKEKGLKESDIRVKILTELSPRECLVRLSAGGQIIPCVKARTVEARFFDSPLSNRPDLVAQPITSSMPQKFVESNVAPELRSVADRADTVSSAESISLEHAQEMDHQARTESTGMINLSTLFAEHSSSRILVNKRKEKP